jgi:hypothetical protein
MPRNVFESVADSASKRTGADVVISALLPAIRLWVSADMALPRLGLTGDDGVVGASGPVALRVFNAAGGVAAGRAPAWSKVRQQFFL